MCKIVEYVLRVSSENRSNINPCNPKSKQQVHLLNIVYLKNTIKPDYLLELQLT